MKFRYILFCIGLFFLIVGGGGLLMLNLLLRFNNPYGEHLATTMNRYEVIIIADAIVGAILVSLNMPKKE